jgi:hypothetical protein
MFLIKYEQNYTTNYLEWDERKSYKSENYIFVGENYNQLLPVALHHILVYGDEGDLLRENSNVKGTERSSVICR